MPMGIVSDKEFDSELSNSSARREGSNSSSVTISPSPTLNNGVINGVVEEISRGRVGPAIPDSLRKLIGSEAIEGGRQSALELASNFDISPSSVSAYGVGAKSTTTYDTRPNLNHINEVKEKISKVARNKLRLALHNITVEKLSAAGVRDLAGVAKDMSAIVRNMEPETPNGESKNNGPTFIFYSPQFRKEEHFELVQAKE